MAVTVGTNSYLTLSEFKAWADLRGKDYSSFTDDQMNAALVVSSLDYIDPNYKFKGINIEDVQAMNLPTDEVAISDIANGASQAAWQALNDELLISPSANTLGQVTKQRDKLDVLETETEYQEGTAAFYTHDTTQIDRLLDPYTVGNVGGNMGRVRKC